MRKCPYDHRLTNNAHLSAITVQTFLGVFTYYLYIPVSLVSYYSYKMASKSIGIDMEQNYHPTYNSATVTVGSVA